MILQNEVPEIPPAWTLSADKILLKNGGRILVVGATDTGKSTYCRFLSGVLLRAGRKVAVIDADIGQKDIGPPACIAVGYPNLESGGTISPILLYFVGDVTPARHFLPMVLGVGELAGAVDAHFKIINTTGLVHGIGLTLKSFVIETTRPRVIVAIQRTRELENILHAFRNYEIMRIPSSLKAMSKTPADRRVAREYAFRQYFRSASEIALNVKDLIFRRTLLFNGKAVKDLENIHREESGEGVLIVSNSRLGGGPGVRFLAPGFETNLLCGLADPTEVALGMGIIRGIDFRRSKIRIWSPVQAEKIAIIQFGDIYVDLDGRELGRRKPGDF